MAVVWGSIVGSYGRIGINKVVTETATQVKLSVEVWIWTKYSCSDTNNALYYNNLASSGSATTKIGSKTVNTTSDSGGWAESNKKKLYTASTITYNKGTSTSTRYLYAKLTNVDRVGGTMTVSTTYVIPKLASYAVSYNANGGSGAPASQTKYYGKSLTLSKTKPTRTGYTFKGWATSASGAVAYASGASYTGNAKLTLYAVWQEITYAVKYDANGGTGAPASQTKYYTKALTLSSTKPTRENYNFLGWGTSASGSVAYAAGASYTTNAAITLYAIWELAYIKPRITNLSVVRCDASGVEKDDGTSALVKFDWETDYDVTEIAINWKLTTDADYTGSKPVTASGTSDSVSIVIGEETLSAEYSYTVQIVVADSNGNTPKEATLASMAFTMHAKPGGKGIAFGKMSELDDVAEFEFEAKFNSPVYGKALGMDRLPQIPANSSLNDYLEPGCYAIYSNADAKTIYCKEGVLLGSDGAPPAKAGRLEVWSATGEGVRLEQWSYLRQRFIPYNRDNPTWEREIVRGENNVWTYYEWWRTTLTPTLSQKLYELYG